MSKNLKVEDGGVYLGEDLMGEYIDNPEPESLVGPTLAAGFLPNLDLMNLPEEIQQRVHKFAMDNRPHA